MDWSWTGPSAMTNPEKQVHKSLLASQGTIPLSMPHLRLLHSPISRGVCLPVPVSGWRRIRLCSLDLQIFLPIDPDINRIECSMWTTETGHKTMWLYCSEKCRRLSRWRMLGKYDGADPGMEISAWDTRCGIELSAEN